MVVLVKMTTVRWLPIPADRGLILSVDCSTCLANMHVSIRDTVATDGDGYGYDGGYEPADDGDDEPPMLACEPEGARLSMHVC